MGLCVMSLAQILCSGQLTRWSTGLCGSWKSSTSTRWKSVAFTSQVGICAHSARTSFFRRCPTERFSGVTWNFCANVSRHESKQRPELHLLSIMARWIGPNLFVFISDVLASQDQSGGDATVTIDQRKHLIEKCRPCSGLHLASHELLTLFHLMKRTEHCYQPTGAWISAKLDIEDIHYKWKSRCFDLWCSLTSLLCVSSCAYNPSSSEHAHCRQGVEAQPRPQNSPYIWWRRAQLAR